MLGLGPAPEVAAVPAPQVYSAPLTGALLATVGMSVLVLLALMPAMLDVGWLGFALFGMPLAVAGAGGVLLGYGVLSTRIEVAPDGVVLAVPGWRGCPFPPAREYRLTWADVHAVRHRSELYRIGRLPWRLPLEVYAIETADGFIPFGGYYLADLEPVLIDLTQRANCPWREDDEVEAGLWRTLLSGAPPWRSTGIPPSRRPHGPRNGTGVARMDVPR